MASACETCGEPTELPPYCIECDMTGRARANETLRTKHPEVHQILEEHRGRRMAKGGGGA